MTIGQQRGSGEGESFPAVTPTGRCRATDGSRVLPLPYGHTGEGRGEGNPALCLHLT